MDAARHRGRHGGRDAGWEVVAVTLELEQPAVVNGVRTATGSLANRTGVSPL